MIKLSSTMIQSKNNKEKKIYIIKNGNPISSNSERVWEKVKQEIKFQDISFEYYETQYEGHAKEIAESILQATLSETILVAIGGDGTLHEIMNGAILYPHARVVCFPAGSGNDYVRGIQKTKSNKEIIQIVQANQHSSMIDVGSCVYEGKKKYFVNSLGVGFDASVSKAVNESKWKKRFQTIKLSKFIYLYYFFKNLFTFKPFQLKAIIDGQAKVYDKVWFLVVCNQPYFGGGFKISPTASVSDGKFNAIVVSKLSPVILLLLFSSVLWGGHLKLKWVESFTCKDITLSTEDLVPIQADGEHIGNSSISAKVVPQAIHILTS